MTALFSCNVEQGVVEPSTTNELYTFHYKGQTYVENVEEGKPSQITALQQVFSNPNYALYVNANDLKTIYVFDDRSELESYLQRINSSDPKEETCSARVTLYQNKNYGGASLQMCNSIFHLYQYSFSDVASSMTATNYDCSSALYVHLYRDSAFGGPSVTVGASVGETLNIPDFDELKFYDFFGLRYGKINDKVSSIAFSDGSNCTPIYQANPVNKALNATASASSTFSGYSASRVNDGNRNTTAGGAHSWTNAHTSGSGLGGDGRLPEYVQLNFGSSTEVSMFRVYTSTNYEIKQYRIQYRNSLGGWTTAVNQSNNYAVSRTHTISPVVTTAVRLYAERGPDNQSIYARVNEFEVY
ncbi:MAG: discoidin domain-containing protein [Flammeovirgaceae bacterium]